ncbi:hypothetical protein FF1_012736 [Malus domestica]
MNSVDSVSVPKPSSKSAWLSAPTSLFLILIIPIFAATLIYQLDSFDPAPVPFSELTRHLIKKAPAQNSRMLRGAERVLEKWLLFLYLQLAAVLLLQVFLITTRLLFTSTRSGSCRRNEGCRDRASNQRCAFSRKCARLVKEQRARFYVVRCCVTMLICWHDYSDS